MVENHEAGLSSLLGYPSVDTITETLPETSTRENDAALLALEKRFNALAAELDRDVECLREEVGREALTKEVEATLARLALSKGDHGDAGVHDRGVGRESAPRRPCVVPVLGSAHRSDRLGCAGAVRLLIEAVCDVARTLLPFRT
jgi:hypothetical protein